MLGVVVGQPFSYWKLGKFFGIDILAEIVLNLSDNFSM